MNRLIQVARVLLVNVLAVAGLLLFGMSVMRLSKAEDEVLRIDSEWVNLSVKRGVVDGVTVPSPESSPPDDGGRAVVHSRPVEPLAPVPTVEIDRRRVVILDPGHGGRDGGTIAGGALEKRLNLDAANRVARRLRRAGVRVVFTRDDDTYVSLAGRVAIANRYPGAIFVSIHHNASTDPQPRGFETYYTMEKAGMVLAPQRRLFGARPGERFVDRRSKLLATEIQGAFALATGAVDRGIKDRSLVVTRMVSCPAVLVECGFLSNPTELKNLQGENYREKMSAGVAGGIMKYLNKVRAVPALGVFFPDRPAPSRGGASLAETQPERSGS